MNRVGTMIAIGIDGEGKRCDEENSDSGAISSNNGFVGEWMGMLYYRRVEE
jgi:hypothetical protein